jgi:hypothetical protein
LARKEFQDPYVPGGFQGIPFQPQLPAPDGRGKRIAAILVPTALVALVTALCAVFLLGVVKVGTPSLSAISMSSSIDRSNRPMKATTQFSVDDESIYCCATARAFADTKLKARWFREGRQVAQFTGKFGDMAGGASPVKSLTTKGRIAFELERPSDGWTTGSYSVRLAVNGREAGARSFTVSKAPDGSAGTRYDDPSGAFSILVPAGWLPAEPSSLGGALAGFISPAGPYPPRYAVSLTDFTSVETGYLDDALRQSGAKAGEVFSSYSVGQMVGARRVFEWDYVSGQEKYRLKTIQIVLQKEGKVYSIDCHSLALDFDANEPTFNTVVNSFR